MLEDELKQSVIELQALVKRAFEFSTELVRRGGDAFRSQIALERDWSSLQKPSKQLAAVYLEETERIKTLAQDFSSWIKEHPETDTEYLKNASAQLRSLPTEEKLAFVKQLIEDRTDRLERQLPELKNLVDRIDVSLLRLKEIVLNSSK